MFLIVVVCAVGVQMVLRKNAPTMVVQERLLKAVVVCAVDVQMELGRVLYLVVQPTPRQTERSAPAINTLVLSLAVATQD